MVKTALFVRLEAKPGKEAEVESFLAERADVSDSDREHGDFVAVPFGEPPYFNHPDESSLAARRKVPP